MNILHTLQPLTEFYNKHFHKEIFSRSFFSWRCSNETARTFVKDKGCGIIFKTPDKFLTDIIQLSNTNCLLCTLLQPYHYTKASF